MTAHPSHVQFVNPPTLFSPPGYTQAVEITGGRTVYIAGQTALDKSFHVNRNCSGKMGRSCWHIPPSLTWISANS